MIVVMYDCKLCGTRHRKVEVRERYHDEEVVAWLAVVQEAVDLDHSAMGCRSRVCDLMIPITGREVIGGPIVQ